MRSHARILAVVLLLSGCSSQNGVQATGSAPVTIENCGQSITFNQEPQRVVGYYQHPTELLVGLGVQDKIAGTVYPDNDPLPQYRDVYRAIPKISDKDASFEQLLTRQPDLVYGGYDSAFDDKSGRSRKVFADAGILTYLSREECLDAPVTMDHVYDEVRTMGQIFRVPERADKLVGEMQASIAKATTRLGSVEPLKVFVYDSGDSTAYTAGGTGIGNEIIRLAGGRNVFGDVQKDWADVSWEQVLQRAPDVIVIYDYYGTPSIEQKTQALLDRPELASVPAVKNRRFATLTLQDTVLGIRAPYAVERLAAQLHPDRTR